MKVIITPKPGTTFELDDQVTKFSVTVTQISPSGSRRLLGFYRSYRAAVDAVNTEAYAVL